MPRATGQRRCEAAQKGPKEGKEMEADLKDYNAAVEEIELDRAGGCLLEL